MLSFKQAIEFEKREAKFSHAEVDYQDHPFEGDQCASCAMHVPPDGCTEVESPIKPSGWCRLYEAGRNAETKMDIATKSQPCASDVHATTALGNEGKRKAKDFLTTISEIKGGARVVGVPASDGDGVGKSGKDKGAKTTMFLVRHGQTRLNNQNDLSEDRIRSWADVPLTTEGREEAKEAAEDLEKYDIECIICSDLSRAHETAEIIGKALGVKPTTSLKLRPWDLGEMTGQSTKEALPKIAEYAHDTPDEPVPEGESFNDFSKRAFAGLRDAIKKANGKTLLIVTHHRNERLYNAWIENGQPDDHSIDLREFLKKGDPPGSVQKLEIDEKALAGKKIKKGVSVTFNINTTGADEANAVLRYLREHAPEIAGDVAARLGKGPKSEDDDKGKDGLDKSLKARDDGMAHSPFPHDAHALQNMRPDQVPRFLGALTDQDRLPIKTVRLDRLVAMQDRVDPEKVEAMQGENMPDKLPLVVRNGSRDIVADGHHRLAAMHEDGRKTAQVRFIDITQESSAVKRDQQAAADESADWQIPFKLSKADDEQRKVFGWASVTHLDGELVIDKQDDIITEDELEQAADDFVLYCRKQGDMHERMGVGRLIRSMLFNKQMSDLGFVAIDPESGQQIYGWFCGFFVDDDRLWSDIKLGKKLEFSIGGKAIRSAI